MTESYDIVIVGGGVMGCSAAYHLALDGRAGRIAVIERDPTYEFASTPRSAGGVRQQFSLPENILMSRFGLGFYQSFPERMEIGGETGPDVGLRQGGYLFLSTEAGRAALEDSHRTQIGLGAPVELLDAAGLKAKYPSMVLDGIALGSFGREDGWMDPHTILQGFRRKTRSLGVTFVADTVTDVARAGSKVTGVAVASGAHLGAGVVVNTAGAWSREICAMVGMALPVEPVRRMAHYFEIKAKLEPLPLTIDPSGVYFRPEGAGYIGGLSNPDEPVGYNFEVDPDWFETAVWPGLAVRVPAFETLKQGRAWAGLYDINRLDENLIIGPWRGEIDNFHIACGFSGHGLQQAPAVGRALKELILDGGFRTIDLARLTYDRVPAGRAMRERAIV
ncbi:MAG: FAD-binding oxidoreductase [Alphaproteobacteria bacterium]|nr:FAD-binding oxidoreductase [Alphaproteobacteria bacterium]